MTHNCGNCSYGKYVDSQHVECHGNPPQVILLPGPNDLAGHPRMIAQKLRPQMDNGETACHLWKSKIAVEVPSMPRPGSVIIR